MLFTILFIIHLVQCLSPPTFAVRVADPNGEYDKVKRHRREEPLHTNCLVLFQLSQTSSLFSLFHILRESITFDNET
jgi:hypothetical protein